MDQPPIDQLLRDLPTFIDDYNGRSFLHLQPWSDRAGWNAFYGCIGEDGWAVHPFYSSQGDDPREALLNLQSLLVMRDFTLEADPGGYNELAARKMGSEPSA